MLKPISLLRVILYDSFIIKGECSVAKKNNRKCICCSEEYRYCNSCAEDRMKPVWYTLYHNENCKNVFNTASDYLANAITKEEAKEKFDKCDLSYKDKMHHKIVEAINDVYGIVNPVFEEVVEAPIIEEKVVEVEEKELKKFNKKKVVFE